MGMEASMQASKASMPLDGHLLMIEMRCEGWRTTVKSLDHFNFIES